MHAPQFWHKPSTIGKLLSPLSLLWRSGSTIHTFLNHSPCIKPGQIALTLIGPRFLAIDLVIVFNAPLEEA